MLVEDAEARLDVRDEGWRFSLLERCDEPGGCWSCVMERDKGRFELEVYHSVSSAPLLAPPR